MKIVPFLVLAFLVVTPFSASALITVNGPKGNLQTCDPTKGNQDCTFPSGNYSLCRQADFTDTEPGFYCMRCLATTPPAGQNSGGQYCTGAETNTVSCNVPSGACVLATPPVTATPPAHECDPTLPQTGCQEPKECRLMGTAPPTYRCVDLTTASGGSTTAGAGTTQTGGTLTNPLKATSIQGLLAIILDGVVQIGSILLVLMLVWVGFLFVFAQGSEEKIKSAREALMWTVIGGLVLLGSSAISQLIKSTVDAL